MKRKLFLYIFFLCFLLEFSSSSSGEDRLRELRNLARKIYKPGYVDDFVSKILRTNFSYYGDVLSDMRSRIKVEIDNVVSNITEENTKKFDEAAAQYKNISICKKKTSLRLTRVPNQVNETMNQCVQNVTNLIRSNVISIMEYTDLDIFIMKKADEDIAKRLKEKGKNPRSVSDIPNANEEYHNRTVIYIKKNEQEFVKDHEECFLQVQNDFNANITAVKNLVAKCISAAKGLNNSSTETSGEKNSIFSPRY